jgi:hypothetical protein
MAHINGQCSETKQYDGKDGYNNEHRSRLVTAREPTDDPIFDFHALTSAPYYLMVP